MGVNVLAISGSVGPVWANPLWAILDFDASTELEHIKHRISQAVHGVPQAQWKDIDFSPESVRQIATAHPSFALEIQYHVLNWWYGHKS